MTARLRRCRLRAWPGLAVALILFRGLPGSPAGAAEEPSSDCGAFSFREVSAAAGLDFRHDRGATGGKHLPETMGPGLAWLDYDGDGWRDLYVVQSGPFPPGDGERSPDALFRNRGDGTFEDVSASARTGRRAYGQGVVAADVDGDGATDLYLTRYGPDALLLNRGDGAFDDGTAAAGLDANGWSSSAALADADGDGDLDLYVARYIAYDAQAPIRCTEEGSDALRYCDPSLFVGEDDFYYRNLGGGRFVEAAGEAAIAPAEGRGLGVVFADLDGDGRPDLYVANDLDPNLVLRNVGGGTFEDRSLVSGAALSREGRPQAGMGIGLGDLDGDGDPDLVVTNFDVETNADYRNEGGLLFEDVAAASGVGLPSFNRLGFGVVARDFDGDGALDLWIANGHIFERPARANVAYRQPAQLLRGDGRGRFEEVACAALAALPVVARGAAAADYDNDGRPDVAVGINGGPVQLWRNGLASGSWLGVELRGERGNAEAVGAVVTLDAGGRRQRRWVLAGDSYQSWSDKRSLFGGSVGGPAEALEITWPDGRRSRLLDPPPGRYLRVPAPGRD
ncbi:MAG: CRTAC1 family protein [Thermoanaerobaculia bacterium]